MNLEIKPLPVYRGKPALARIHAPLGATKVVGTVVVMGSPRLLFQQDKAGDGWYFYGTIPFSPWVGPGIYKVRVTVSFPHGEPHYTEMQVELK